VTLRDLWQAQEDQQRELGLDPTTLSQVERRRLADDLVLGLHEEVTDVGRLGAGYKRHILRSSSATRGAVANECADILKLTLALAQLHGLTAEEVVQAFHDKTAAVSQRANAERLELTEACRVLVVDIDDVICNLEPWRAALGVKGEEQAAASLKLAITEEMKNTFYAGGRFREMEAIPGAADALARFRRAGGKVVLITARPQWQYKRLHADTVWWLARHQMQYDLLLFSRNKVEAVYEHVRPAWPFAAVEDHPKNAEAYAEAGIPVYLFDQPYNRRVSASKLITRVASWAEITSQIGV
jgi:hypothetical protein